MSDSWDAAALHDPFNRVRAGWDEHDFNTRTDDSIVCGMEFRPDDVVLDYGCGVGYACKLVAPKVSRYVGMDYSEEMLIVARGRNNKFKNAEFIKCDGITIPAPDASFDVVFCELVFQHNERSSTLRAFHEIMFVLKSSGRAALQFPTKFYGDSIGFTVDELTTLCRGWRISSNKNYIYCYR